MEPRMTRGELFAHLRWAFSLTEPGLRDPRFIERRFLDYGADPVIGRRDEVFDLAHPYWDTLLRHDRGWVDLRLLTTADGEYVFAATFGPKDRFRRGPRLGVTTGRDPRRDLVLLDLPPRTALSRANYEYELRYVLDLDPYDDVEVGELVFVADSDLEYDTPNGCVRGRRGDLFGLADARWDPILRADKGWINSCLMTTAEGQHVIAVIAGPILDRPVRRVPPVTMSRQTRHVLVLSD